MIDTDTVKALIDVAYEMGMKYGDWQAKQGVTCDLADICHAYQIDLDTCAIYIERIEGGWNVSVEGMDEDLVVSSDIAVDEKEVLAIVRFHLHNQLRTLSSFVKDLEDVLK